MRALGIGITLAVLGFAACESDGGTPDITSTSAAASTTQAPTTSDPTTSAPSSTTAAPTTTSTTEPPTTSSTFPFEVHEVAATQVCVVGLGVGGTFNVREGPSTDFPVVGTLEYGTIGVETTGWAAYDDDGDEWKQIVFEGQPRWAAAGFLTPGTCTDGAPQTYCVIDQTCGGGLNVRTGLSVDYDILGAFLPTAGDIQGTGVTALDDQDRLWTQVEYGGEVGWSAGWFLDPQPCTPIDCQWIFTATSVGSVGIGMSPAQAVATGQVQGPDQTPSCGRGDATGPYDPGMFQATYDGDTAPDVEIVQIWIRSPQFTTPEGMGIGDTRAQIIAAMGAPTEETTLFYGGWDMIYEYGPYGIAFHLPSQTEPVWDISIGYNWAIRTLWDC